MVKTAIIGATGFTGYELSRILSRHPAAQVVCATSEQDAGSSLAAHYPQAPPLPLISSQEVPWERLDVAFLCLPHGAAAPVAQTALRAGVRVIDLSADFRLKDAGTYARWYGIPHPAPALLDQAVYGLSECARPALRGASLVANPGCYPTSILLPLEPLLAHDAVAGPIIADSKSGVSGAGRTPKAHTHFMAVEGNFTPYAIGRAHRHLPEIEQGLATFHHEPPPFIFSPHLLPVPRGILSTIYVPLRPNWSAGRLNRLFHSRFAAEPFVQVLPEGQLPSLAHVVHSNKVVIGLTVLPGTLIITCAIDNLVKGAAGQAVQNMNLLFGLPETAGLA